MWRLLLGTMGVKSLVQGLNAAATAGFEPRTVWSEVRRRNQLATAPTQKVLPVCLGRFLFGCLSNVILCCQGNRTVVWMNVWKGPFFLRWTLLHAGKCMAASCKLHTVHLFTGFLGKCLLPLCYFSCSKLWGVLLQTRRQLPLHSFAAQLQVQQYLNNVRHFSRKLKSWLECMQDFWLKDAKLTGDVSTDWCSEIGSLTSLYASSDVREPISLHQAVLEKSISGQLPRSQMSWKTI